MTFRVTGQKKLMAKINKVKNAPVVFDDVFKKVVRQALGAYREKTNKDTGDTASAWKAKRLGFSNYIIFNDLKTEGSKIPIAQIINSGRRAVYPVRAKKLFIPLSEKGKARASGLVFGIDFVLADKAKAFKGTKFIDKVNKAYVKKLSTELVNKLRLIHRQGTA